MSKKIDKPKYNLLIHNHQSLTFLFHFVFSGYPQPMYRWLKDGLPMTDFGSSQYYRISNTKRDDAGSYQCIAKNDAGTIFSEKIDVIVACK